MTTVVGFGLRRERVSCTFFLADKEGFEPMAKTRARALWHGNDGDGGDATRDNEEPDDQIVRAAVFAFAIDAAMQDVAVADGQGLLRELV
jgi:hypothetical protein